MSARFGFNFTETSNQLNYRKARRNYVAEGTKSGTKRPISKERHIHLSFVKTSKNMFIFLKILVLGVQNHLSICTLTMVMIVTVSDNKGNFLKKGKKLNFLTNNDP